MNRLKQSNKNWRNYKNRKSNKKIERFNYREIGLHKEKQSEKTHSLIYNKEALFGSKFSSKNLSRLEKKKFKKK